MRKNILSMAVLAALSLAFAQMAQAQDAPVTAQTAEAVVVTGAFLGAGSKSAMKLDVPVRDTPFSVSSYTNSFMKAIETTNVADLYNYMTGVKKAGNTGYDMTIRGFKTGGDDKNAIMVDGLPGLTGRFGSPPTAGVDHIELVKGPMSVLYGQAQPGGFVNIVSKKPKGVQATEVELKGLAYRGDKLQFNDAKGYVASVDTTGPIDAAGNFMYRFIVESANKDLFRDYSYERSLYIAPSLTWNISDNTSATLQMEHREARTNFDNGIPAPNNDISQAPPITNWYQEPGDFRAEVGETASLALNHSFANDASWNFTGRSVYNHNDDQEFTSTANLNIAGVPYVQRRARKLRINRHYDYYDTNFNLPFTTGSIGHKLTIGVNGGQDIDDENRTQFYNSGACPGPTCLAIRVNNPVYGLVPSRDSLPLTNGVASAANLSDNYFKAKSYGLYASDLITLSDQWKLSVGVRKTHEKQLIQERRFNGPAFTKVSDKVLPLAGLLYQPTKQWTVYTSYATSYVPAPANSVDVTNQNSFKPVSAKQIEVGAKAEKLMDGKLNATFSLYRIQKKDTLTTAAGGATLGSGALCPATIQTCTEQFSGELAKGAELEINGKLTKEWQLTFGYAYTDAKIKTGAPIQVGALLTNVAKNAANLWSRYDFMSGPMKGFGVGVGLVYTGQRTGLLPTTAVPTNLIFMPAYTTVDLGLYYTFDRYAFNFKIGNLFDKKYYESAGQTAPIQIAPGAPRNLALSMTAHF